MTDAIKLAIEALESCTDGDYSTGHVIPPDFDRAMVDAALAALRAQPDHSEQYLEMIAAARAVVERWDTPLWKDVPATAVYINRLRDALPAIGEAKE